MTKMIGKTSADRMRITNFYGKYGGVHTRAIYMIRFAINDAKFPSK